MSLTVSTSLPSQHEASSTASTVVKPAISRQPSTSSNKGKSLSTSSRRSTLKSPARSTFANSEGAADDATWGSNFWVTLVDPQTQTSFFACPATGQVSWDPPVGTFVLPPSEDGEWWELSDDSRGGIPYYYQTKTGETVWERPSGFVIPLGILQEPTPNNTHLSSQSKTATGSRLSSRRSGERLSLNHASTSKRHNMLSVQLTPIPGSPNPTITSAAPSITSKPSPEKASTTEEDTSKLTVPKEKDSPGRKVSGTPQQSYSPDSISRARSKSSTYTPHKAQQPQSLDAALEILSSPPSDSGHGASLHQKSATETSMAASSVNGRSYSTDEPTTPTRRRQREVPPSPSRPVPETPKHQATVGGKGISSPVLNLAATLQMSPVKNRANGKPIAVEAPIRPMPGASVATLPSGTYPILPQALATDIQLFSESEYAKQYFSTHKTGFIFRRKVPVAQLMSWQKAPLTAPLLSMNRTLNKNAVKVFKVIQHIMGDREREKPVNVRLQPDNHVSMVASFNASTTSLSSHAMNILEEERWLLSEGLTHGELRDEIYCQVMKQVTGNPNKESVFKGWQFLCVLLITFPPSKNFETYLHGFIQKHTTQQEGRVDVMAKHCLRRLVSISKKGPRGKPPIIAEIETASDAAFNPSTFGESLDAIIRLQERNYPHQKIPIILPFLADGILALGGTKSEGIFRVPGDNDSVSGLKLRIDRGYYTLDGVDDPHVLASLMKLWLRELCDPLVPEELYNECIQNSKDPEACVQIVERLPTINRRVVLFIISFLQLFLEERTQSVTKMTPANLALVMAPNLLRCNSESMSVVFTNAQ
ncbi:hypothetical protein NLJ89_g368 [Agrocybe chaxingu]|uniref:Rho GTPase-activating protein 39 n=1 Tax=Agrocybe chaxingu TaxID=84603 RepID=A0A9W8TF01_9AGAR|nr:hypothetical protein NLJ89_g368 [Agrocybe chaxingu]